MEYKRAKESMKKLVLTLLTILTLSAFSVSAETKSWSVKAIGTYCEHSICRCTAYYDTETKSCWVMIGNVRRDVFRLNESIYNAYFQYDDCYYMLDVPYWH